MLDDLTLTAGLGASVGGDLRILGQRHSMSPGPLGVVGAAYRILDGDGWEPFLLFGGAFSMSSVVTERRSDGATARLFPLDARFSLTAGEVFMDSIAPYLAVRGFGGPVNWSLDGQDLTGTDKYHFQVGGGLLVTAGVVDAFFELIPLGERAATFGGAVSF